MYGTNNIKYFIEYLVTFFLGPSRQINARPYSVSKQATTTSFNIFCNALFTK